MRPDVADFYSGISFDAFRLLGAHPAGPGRGWGFTVWAPHARRVQVLGDWNGWNLYRCGELAFCEDGLWRGRVRQARAGQLYKYNIQGPDGVWRLRPDPFAFGFEDLPGTASRLADPGAPVPSLRGTLPAVPRIYEVHAASWRRHWDGRYYPGPELAEALVPYVKAHHFTHVEFLPLAEYPFDGSWGYQGSGYFAPTGRIGGLAGFAALVHALHRAGIGVIMDFVPVHFAPDTDRLAEFDGAPLWEAGPSDWGSLRFDLSGGPVRSFLLSSAAFWVYQCGCDGLRVDAIGSALRSQGQAAAEFFRTLTAGLHARFPGVLLMAEDTACGLRATAATGAGGLGFDLMWDLGWSGAVLAYLALPFCQRTGGFGRFADAQPPAGQEKTLAPLSHDDNASPRGAIRERLYGDEGQRFAQLRMLLLLQAARPGGSLLFAGTEFGQRESFDPYREPNWALPWQGQHRALDEYCAALNLFAAQHPAMADGGFAWAGQDPETGVLGFVRRDGTETLLFAFNTKDRTAQGEFRAPGQGARQIFATAAPESGAPPRCGTALRLTLPPLSGGVWAIG